ncbi:hypothetical protein SynMINOS11_01916 [Synechococcus sp. Minos11]|nr:hypothetical protein SynMINOS11_01916 [Synechococcus sp. Minos11]
MDCPDAAQSSLERRALQMLTTAMEISSNPRSQASEGRSIDGLR